MAVPPNRDLHVTIVILPLLEKYSSTVRFGIKSREFGGKIGDGRGLPQRSVHDGLSFMITGIRWVSNGAGTQNRLRGKARRERIRKALREVELAPVVAAKALNIDTNVTGNAPAELLRTPIQGDVELSGSWWKTKGTPPSEGDKENQPAASAAPAAGEALVPAVVEEGPVQEEIAASKEAHKEAQKVEEPAEEIPEKPTEETVEQSTQAVAEKVAEEITEDIIEKVVSEADPDKEAPVKVAAEKEDAVEKEKAGSPKPTAAETLGSTAEA
jgi:hypothetical protein